MPNFDKPLSPKIKKGVPLYEVKQTLEAKATVVEEVKSKQSGVFRKLNESLQTMRNSILHHNPEKGILAVEMNELADTLFQDPEIERLFDVDKNTLGDEEANELQKNIVTNLYKIYKVAIISSKREAVLKQLSADCRSTYERLYAVVGRELSKDKGAHVPTIGYVVSNLLKKYLDKFGHEVITKKPSEALDYIANKGLNSMYTKKTDKGYMKMGTTDFNIFADPELLDINGNRNLVIHAVIKLDSEECQTSLLEPIPGTIANIDRNGNKWYCLLLSEDGKALLGNATGNIRKASKESLLELKKLTDKNEKKTGQSLMPPVEPPVDTKSTKSEDYEIGTYIIEAYEKGLKQKEIKVNEQKFKVKKAIARDFVLKAKEIGLDLSKISDDSRNDSWIEESFDDLVNNELNSSDLIFTQLAQEMLYQFLNYSLENKDKKPSTIIDTFVMNIEKSSGKHLPIKALLVLLSKNVDPERLKSLSLVLKAETAKSPEAVKPSMVEPEPAIESIKPADAVNLSKDILNKIGYSIDAEGEINLEADSASIISAYPDNSIDEIALEVAGQKLMKNFVEYLNHNKVPFEHSYLGNAAEQFIKTNVNVSKNALNFSTLKTALASSVTYFVKSYLVSKTDRVEDFLKNYNPVIPVTAELVADKKGEASEIDQFAADLADGMNGEGQNEDMEMNKVLLEKYTSLASKIGYKPKYSEEQTLKNLTEAAAIKKSGMKYILQKTLAQDIIGNLRNYIPPIVNFKSFAPLGVELIDSVKLSRAVDEFCTSKFYFSYPGNVINPTLQELAILIKNEQDVSNQIFTLISAIEGVFETPAFKIT